jgi:hypothetical protein
LPLGTTLYYHGEEPNHIKTSLEEREEKKWTLNGPRIFCLKKVCSQWEKSLSSPSYHNNEEQGVIKIYPPVAFLCF